MVKMSFSPSVQKKKWTKSGQNPVIYQGFFDFPGRAIFSLFCENLTLSYKTLYNDHIRFDLMGPDVEHLGSSRAKFLKDVKFFQRSEKWIRASRHMERVTQDLGS